MDYNNIKPLENKRKATAKMDVYDWQQNIPANPGANPQKLIEVRFKNTRKGYYSNSGDVQLKIGDIIAVEGNPGTDIGTVTMISPLVMRQIKRTCQKIQAEEIKKVLRIATPQDIEKWGQAIAREHSTMIESRAITADLKLEMKIGDVEFQGDGIKAIFYYIAEGRVDFRELIKVLFERFRVRVEMRQIGARQEAGRIGGIGPCGREVCCSSWKNHFATIGTAAAKAQDISFNPQKLAGQCGKLKCCMSYELDSYLDARKALPRVTSPLEAMDGNYYLAKTDILSGTMYFSPAQNNFSILIPLSTKRVKEIQALNAKGQKVDSIEDKKFLARAAEIAARNAEPEFKNIELDESLTRFDKGGKPKGGRGGKGGGGNRNGRGGNRSGRSNQNRNAQSGNNNNNNNNGSNGGNGVGGQKNRNQNNRNNNGGGNNSGNNNPPKN